MSQPPDNFEQQPDVNSTQQADSYTSQNVVQGNQNRAVQGNENQGVLGDNNTVVQGNKSTQNIHITNYYYREDIRLTAVQPAEDAASDKKLPCPYRGLYHFSPDDAEYFFGREVFIEELFRATQTRNFIPVLGASGSGKSSVVLAGLVPKLQQEGHWLFTHFRPGSEPFYALAQALVPLYEPEINATEQMYQARQLAEYFVKGSVPLKDVFTRIARNYANHRVLLIADQFEELYTLCSDEKIRRSFLDILLAGFKSESNHFSLPPMLVSTMRADFLGNALAYPPFADVLRNADIKLIRSMNRSELSEVIAKPAQKLGVTFQDGLIERILDDVESEPGNLPLLEFALTKLWEKRTNQQLTHAAYEAIGEVQGALASYADKKYDSLSNIEQEQVRRIFIQLVRPGEGNEDTRRLAIKAELGETSWELVTKLADARLVVTSQNANAQETVEVVHEALIRNWGKLLQWMEIDRNFRAWQERLRAAMFQWEDAAKDDGALLRGVLLAEAENWQQKRFNELSPEERVFIHLSLALQDKQKKEQQRRQRRTILGLAGGLVTVSIFAGIAVRQWQLSEIGRINAKINAFTASSEALFVSDQKFDALLDALRAGILLKQATYVKSDTKMQVITALQQTVYGVTERNRLQGHNAGVTSVSFSPNGQIIATASRDETIKLWNIDGTLLKTLQGHSAGVTSVSFSPNGQIISTASSDKTIKLWSIDGTLLKTLQGHRASINSVSFSPNGKMLASASGDVFTDDKTVKLWSINGTLLKTLQGHTDNVNSVSFSPDGKMLASASDDGTVRLWNINGTLLKTLKWQGHYIEGVSFSPNGKIIAALDGLGNEVKFWSIDGKELKTFKSEMFGRYSVRGSGQLSISFRPNGQQIASSGGDSAVRIWPVDDVYNWIFDNKKNTLSPSLTQDVDNKEIKTYPLLLTGHSGQVTSVNFSPDSKTLASASSDGSVKLWKLDTKEIILPKKIRTSKKQISLTEEENLFIFNDNVSFSPDGKLIVFSSSGGRVTLCSKNGKELKTFIAHNTGVTGISFSPDGKTFATAGQEDKTIKLWSLNGSEIKTLKADSNVESISFSPDGKFFATVSGDDTVILWSKDGKELKSLKGGHGRNFKNVSFSPDGKFFATASWNGTVILWSQNGREHKTLKGHSNVINNVTFSPDGKLLATASFDNTVKLWRVDGTLLKTLRGHSLGVNSVSFSPDGQIIASSGEDNTIKLWSLDGRELRTLTTSARNGVRNLNFSPNGKALASSGDQVILWNLDLDDLLMQSCAWVGDYLKTNSSVNESERHLCDGIGTGK
ncbi:WD-40 repeat-containing protein (plasmid) [Anabaenopsis circularis NIES-21]|uniref:WD-40 repeat-containing protein n=1 Tax=Anabaenopsis circularis NIES-21 TaxID=1085406 RepID=A0A1Z4GRT1_9CYAN|nr:WD-40 repeat-containing protein [Anabaenopsis circularis NIES-21]